MVTGVVPHVGGPIVAPGEPTVLIEFLPAARMTDMLTCVGPPDMIMMGSPTVLIGFLMAARIGDPTVHGGVIVVGAPTVMIGEVGMGMPETVVVPPLVGGAGGTPASGPAETGASSIGAGAAMLFAAQTMNSAPAQALASSSQNGTPFIKPCPG
jgi:uncharacterized Zn-binding protein involved in type VI secretion